MGNTTWGPDGGTEDFSSEWSHGHIGKYETEQPYADGNRAQSYSQGCGYNKTDPPTYLTHPRTYHLPTTQIDFPRTTWY